MWFPNPPPEKENGFKSFAGFDGRTYWWHKWASQRFTVNSLHSHSNVFPKMAPTVLPPVFWRFGGTDTASFFSEKRSELHLLSFWSVLSVSLSSTNHFVRCSCTICQAYIRLRSWFSRGFVHVSRLPFFIPEFCWIPTVFLLSSNAVCFTFTLRLWYYFLWEIPFCFGLQGDSILDLPCRATEYE